MIKTEEYIAHRKSGKSFQQIADEYGVTKQAVQEAIQSYGNRHIKSTTVIFPGLRNWMTENRVYVRDLENLTGCSLRYALHTGRVNTQKVNAILEVTKLSYEEAFGDRNDEDNDISYNMED